MIGEKGILLLFVARLLEYPNDELVKDIRKLEELFSEEIQSFRWYAKFSKIYQSLLTLEDRKWQELYVNTFDYKEKTSLYLTAHEFGESRNRGMALIDLQKYVGELGFEKKSNELIDYMPVLLEVVAVSPFEQTTFLRKRLAVALELIQDHLPKENPYYSVLQLLFEYVFIRPKESEKKELLKLWEEPDLDPMPYPLFYQ